MLYFTQQSFCPWSGSFRKHIEIRIKTMPSTKTKITSKQEARIGDLVVAALRTLDLSSDEAQEIIKSGGTLQTEIKPILRKLAIEDRCFGSAITEFEFTVPADYNHDRQLTFFAEATKGLSTTYYFHEGLTSKNFAKATNRLEPGKTYKVKIFPILAQVTSEDCMTFLRKKDAILVGGQGLSLVQLHKPEEFPVNKYTVSFDEKDALWEDSGGYRRVPYVDRDSDGDWGFDLGFFEKPWSGDLCLLCLCDL